MAGTYNDLANAATNANGKLEGKDLEKNVEDRRTTLQKLIDAASKDGLTFKINVDSLDVNQLNATFSKVEKSIKISLIALRLSEEITPRMMLGTLGLLMDLMMMQTITKML